MGDSTRPERMIPAGSMSQRGHRHTKSFIESERIRPAGVYDTDNKGEPVLAAKLVHVPEIIKVEKPSAPIKDKNTTYNTVHAKNGFPYHYSPEKSKPVEPKHIQTYERVPAGKRHPFEVKSRPRLL
jgi:hypothetical protein